MLMRFFVIAIAFFFVQGCSNFGGDHQENLAKMDEMYGKCDNPLRDLRPIEYQICKDKERAAGPDGEVGDPFSITDAFSSINSGGGRVYASSNTNTYLWDASLSTLSPYSIKISDFDGGYIETNWILKSDFPNERCLIKTHIISPELISTGVKVKVICEELQNNNWYTSEQSFVDQEKQLTLKILNEASLLSQAPS